jgi:hypothetical protein
MMQGLFGNMMGGGAGGQEGAGGMDSMMAELMKGMGMGMPPGNNK